MIRQSLAQAAFARVILPAGVITPALAPWIWPASPALAVGLIVGSHLTLLGGTLLPNNQLFGPVITGFDNAPGEVWLTIDDGPDPEDTPRILDALDAAGARATFFVRGDRAREHAGLVAEIELRGHSLGNHTFSHPQRMFWGLPPSGLTREMDGCSDILREITGKMPMLFRAPVGMVNPYVHRAAHERGMQVIGWSARAFDAGLKVIPPELVTVRIMRDLRPGGIALLHEGSGSAHGLAPRNVSLLLQHIHERGWRAATPALVSSSATPAAPR